MNINWKNAPNAPVYLPALHAAEIRHGIPLDLLARIAYQESHFRFDIVSGAVRSPAGAVGLMQLEPSDFPGAGASWLADIETAARLLSGLHERFQDWQVAVAAYNDGCGNIDMWLKGQRALPLETENYVHQVASDVGLPGSIVDIGPAQEAGAELA